MITFRKATPRDILSIARRLRKADAEELIAAAGGDPAQAMMESLAVSELCVVADIYGSPECVFGLTKYDEHKAVPWMVGTDQVPLHKKSLMKHGRRYVGIFLDRYPVLVNQVHAANTASVKWLQALGFTILPAVPSGVSRELFHPFYRLRI